MKVFIVDDSAPVRQVLRSLLEDMGGVQVIGQAGADFFFDKCR